MRSRHLVPTILATAVALTVALGGCSALPAGSPLAPGQSVSAGCKQLEKSTTTVAESISAVGTEIGSDPKSAATKFSAAAATYSDEVDSIKNDKVRKVAQPAAQSIVDFSTVLTDFAADPAGADASAITDASTKMSTTLSAIGTVCK